MPAIKKILNKDNAKYLLYISWIQSLLATLGSLYFSEILHYPPCVLCWYQRIFMYPLVLLIPVAVIKKDKNIPYYLLPLVTIGGIIAIYHNLLYWKIIPEAQAPCQAGISCTSKFIEWFGFVTIPFLSFLGFALIFVCMILFASIYKNKKKNGRL
jgi:disulfide bond formation protein DsbB